MNALRQAGKWITVISSSIALLPVALVLLSAAIAHVGSCNINEAAVSACNIGGINVGGILYFMSLSGWFALITLPIGGAIALISLLIYLTSLVILHRRSETLPVQG